jgi:23S rRNA-/tRNA-specific pseudouridylate synthase
MSSPPDADVIEVDETDDVGAGEGPLTLVATAAVAGQRLDKALALLLPEVSRSRLQQWIEDGAVRVDGAAARVRTPRVRHPCGAPSEVRSISVPLGIACMRRV